MCEELKSQRLDLDKMIRDDPDKFIEFVHQQYAATKKSIKAPHNFHV